MSRPNANARTPVKRLLTRAEAAGYCSVSEAVFDRVCPVVPISLDPHGHDKRLFRYDVAALDEWIDVISNRVAPAGTAADTTDWLAKLG